MYTEAFKLKKVIVVGCGLAGSVIARYLAEKDYLVDLYDRRNHIGGNMYDYKDKQGILVHKYGPHTFHTVKKELYDYMCKYEEWDEYKLTCGAVINNKFTPTPFNYQTIDDFFSEDMARRIKDSIEKYYPNQDTATVLELLHHEDDNIREYAEFLFEKDYSLYTAKQWGISPKEIDPSVLKRVPIRFNYDVGYFDDEYQVMPRTSYVRFFENLLNHKNINIHLNIDVLNHISLNEDDKTISWDGSEFDGVIIYTGALDELFGLRYGKLPYRSLRFEWKSEEKKSFQDAPVVAYPEAKGYTRITEYTKLPVQDVGNRTTYAVEYSVPYKVGSDEEPYYPIPNDENQLLYDKYRELAVQYKNMYLCGRLASYRYLNMDQVLETALEVCEKIE